jgi:CubicO group peptidase (beta-lactamase class C family)
MRATSWRALAVTLVCVLAPAAGAADDPFPKATPESQGLAAKDLDALADVVAGIVKADQVVGAELLVVKNGRTVLHRGFGWKNRDKKAEMPVGTIFCVRSMTKPVVGVAVQMLIDDGKLSPDDPVAKYLPSFDTDKSRGITVRQLLTHTGGLKLSTLLSVGLKGVSGVRELADVVGKNGPELKPGEKFNYSDDGADTLTALVGAVAGKPAEEFLQERLFDPIGMKDSICVLKSADPRVGRVATAYAGAKGAWVKFWAPGETPIFPYFLGSQGLYSTAPDYARFLKLIADGGKWGGKQLLSKEALARILTPAEARGGMPTGFDDRRGAYGQMMMLYLGPDGKVRAFGHGGSDGTHAYAFPDKDLLVLYFTQSRGNLTSLDFEAALHRLLIDPGKAAVAEKPVDAKAAAPYLGLYWFDAVKCPVPVEVRDGKVVVEFPFQAEIELKPGDGPDKWVARLNPSIEVEFKREGAGAASGLVLRQPGATHEMPRLKKDEGLPTADEVMKLREKTQGTAALAKLGVVRIKGTLEQLPANKKGTLEYWIEGAGRYRMDVTVGGETDRQASDGEKTWVATAGKAPEALDGVMAEQARLNHPAFAAADWRPLFKDVQVLKRFEAEKKSVILLWCVPREAPSRALVVEAETGRLVGDRHIEIVPGVGRIGKRVQYREYKDVGGVQLPSRVTHNYPTPLLGRFEHTFESFETGAEAPPGAFNLQPGK